MAEDKQEKRKVLSGWGKLWIIVVVLILIYVCLQTLGIDLLKRTEKIEMTDDPHPGF